MRKKEIELADFYINTENVKNNFPLKRTKVTLEIIKVVDAEKVRSFTTGELGDYIRNLMLENLNQE